MVLPRPLIIALAGLALVLMSFVVLQRQRTATDSTAAPLTGPDAAVDRAAPPVDVSPPPPRKQADKTRPSDTAAGPDEAPARRNRPSRPAQAPPGAAKAQLGVPARLSRALSQGKVIALLFTLEGAADDAATRSAVRSLEAGGRGDKAAVFVDGIGNVGRYSRIVGGLGISQVPSVVLIDTERNAQVLEGYLDAGTLRQYVADAQR